MASSRTQFEKTAPLNQQQSAKKNGDSEQHNTESKSNRARENGIKEKAETSDSPKKAETLGLPTKPNVVQEQAPLKLEGFVGITNLPTQYHRYSLLRGFNLNLMVVGSSGLGKTTLINTLFNGNILNSTFNTTTKDAESTKAVEIRKATTVIHEDKIELRLTVIDTPGLGDRINNEGCWKPILQYIESRFDNYLDAETGSQRSKLNDERVHALLYFIEPTGHSLSQLDIDIMKNLHKRVNLLPLIAKSDLLNDEELKTFKSRILNDLKHNQIQIYEIPGHESDDEETRLETQDLQSRMPYAVVGSTQIVEVNGRQFRGRHYPWGDLEIDNPTHSDFMTLKQLLIQTHMEDLKERTSNILYEQYRTDRLVRQGVTQDQTAFRTSNPQEKLAEQRAAQEQRLAKLEAEMRQVFLQKVEEKEQKLEQSEKELYMRHKDMKESLEQQRQELEDRKAKLEAERSRIGTLDGVEKAKKKGFSLK